jgi:IS5 family transposase
LGGSVPHPTTLMKITTRCGEQAIDELNDALLAKAAEARLLKTNRVRADTTVVEANVAYPTDSGLLTKGITALARAAKRLRAAGLATRTRFRDRSRSAGSRCRAINANLRRRSDEAAADVRRINGEIVGLARRTAGQAERVARNARRALRHRPVSGRVRATIDRLERIAVRVRKVADQCTERLAGGTPDGATRIVSLHDPDARAIRKGRIGKPVEFGYKAQLVDNDDGVILDWQLEQGNPHDAPQLAPAIARVTRRCGRAPRTVTADRGYGEAAVDRDLEALGVQRVVIPRKGRPSRDRQTIETSRSFRRHVRWRTGAEGRISCIKRDFGCRRTRMDTRTGARTWTGHGILAHNLVKIAGLVT